MDTGQMNLMPMNIGMSPSVGAQSPVLAMLQSKSGEQAGGLFAGFLEAMTPAKTSQGGATPVLVGKSVPAPEKNVEIASTTVAQDAVPGSKTVLANALDSTGKPLATGTRQNAEAQVTAKSSDSKPQDVVLNAVGPRMALLSRLIGGRTPRADGTAKQLTTGMEQGAGAPLTTNGSASKPQEVVLNAVGSRTALPTQVIDGRMPQAASTADSPVSTLSGNETVAGVVVSTNTDAGSVQNSHESRLNPNRKAMVANGLLKVATTDPTTLTTVSKGNDLQQASQKEPDGTVLPALSLASRQVSVVAGQQKSQTAVDSTISTERGASPNNHSGNVGSAVAPVSGLAAPGNVGGKVLMQPQPEVPLLRSAPLEVATTAEIPAASSEKATQTVSQLATSTATSATMPVPVTQSQSATSVGPDVRATDSSVVEVTTPSQQETPMFRFAPLEAALAESAPRSEARITGQTQTDSLVRNAAVAEIPATSSDKTTQTTLQQYASPVKSGTMPVTAVLSQSSTAVGAEVRATGFPGVEVTTPPQQEVSLSRSASLEVAQAESASRNEVRAAGQVQDVSSAQDAPVAAIPASSMARMAQTEPRQDVQLAGSDVTPAQVAPSPASSQDAGQTNHQTIEVTGAVQAAVVPAAVKTAVAAGEDAPQTRPESVVVAKQVQSITAEAVKFAGAGSSGEESGTGNDKGAADSFMGGQFQATMLHQQGNVASPGASATVVAPVQSDVQQSALSEHILPQVKDTLANHEIKGGNDQIVLRLSPENLGELKVNLSMEGQSLKVEIVAENHMVRNALLQNTDSLKESLARQNISMQSFNVTTGNPGQRQQQGDWRENFRQQQNTWMASAGYQTSDATSVASQLAYQTPSQHAMVDLHF